MNLFEVDQTLRELERALHDSPGDPALLAKLSAARRRSGATAETFLRQIYEEGKQILLAGKHQQESVHDLRTPLSGALPTTHRIIRGDYRGLAAVLDYEVLYYRLSQKAYTQRTRGVIQPEEHLSFTVWRDDEKTHIRDSSYVVARMRNIENVELSSRLDAYAPRAYAPSGVREPKITLFSDYRWHTAIDMFSETVDRFHEIDKGEASS